MDPDNLLSLSVMNPLLLAASGSASHKAAAWLVPHSLSSTPLACSTLAWPPPCLIVFATLATTMQAGDPCFKGWVPCYPCFLSKRLINL